MWIVGFVKFVSSFHIIIMKLDYVGRLTLGTSQVQIAQQRFICFRRFIYAYIILFIGPPMRILKSNKAVCLEISCLAVWE